MDEESNSTITKLLITSVDCNPQEDLFLSGRLQPLDWDSLTETLSFIDYSLTVHRLTAAAAARRSTRKVSFLTLHASQRRAFFYGENRNQETYEITYDETLMNELPSYENLEGFPRFHLFNELPTHLQTKIFEIRRRDDSRTRRNDGKGHCRNLVDNIWVRVVFPVVVYAVSWGLYECVRICFNRYEHSNYDRSRLYEAGEFSSYDDDDDDFICRQAMNRRVGREEGPPRRPNVGSFYSGNAYAAL